MYFDLSLENRNKTGDEITLSTIAAIKEHKIVIKCATINPDEEILKVKNLSNLWISPNTTIRGALNGTIIREPIIFNKIPRIISNWQKTIIVARHAYADLWSAKEYESDKISKAYLLIEKENEETEKILIHDFHNKKGVVLGCFETDESISNFAEFCFETALNRKFPLYLSTKNTILKNMMENTNKFLMNFMKKNILKNYQKRIFFICISLLMIWLLSPLNRKVDFYGLVKTTMEMCNLILLFKDLVH